MLPSVSFVLRTQNFCTASLYRSFEEWSRIVAWMGICQASIQVMRGQIVTMIHPVALILVRKISSHL